MLKHNVGDSPLLNRNCSPILNRPLQYSSPSQSKTLSSPLVRNKVQKTSSPMLSPLTVNTSGAETTDHRFTSEEELNEERKREIAEEILKRSESRKIRKIKQQAEAKVEQEVKLLREQSKQQHLDRLRVFEKSEQQEVEAVRQAAISLEATHHAKSQRKKRLLAKLFSLYAKQRANEVAFENAQNDKLLISLNQVVDSAKTKTREYIEEKSENHNTYLKDHFIKNFEKFICIPKEQEYKEIRESITEYISPAITKIKEEHELAQHSHKLLCNNEKEKYFNTLANKVREYHDHQFNICCSQKVEEINRGKNIIQLTAEEITEFLEADIEEYETAIGVVDAELDRMKKEIFEWNEKVQLKKEYNDKQIDTIKQQISSSTRSNETLKQSIQKLKKQLQQIKQQEEKSSEITTDSLIGLTELTSKNLKVELPKIQQMKLEVEKELQDLGSQLQQTEIVAKESIQSLNIEEDSVKELEAKNMEIDSKALELENNLKKLSERKSELEHEVTSITTKLSRLKHNRQLSTARFEVDMFKEMQCSMEINSKLVLTEERFYKHQSMKFANLLKELCESLEIQVSRNFSILQKMIHLYAVMKVICVIETMSDNPIITIYAEKQLDLFEDMKTIMRKTAPDDVVNATLTRVHQMRPMLLFFSKLFDHDCMKYHTGTWRQSLDNLDELKHANVKFKYVEKRLISILDALLEKTHLDVKSILSQHDDSHNDSTICSCIDPLLHDNMHSLDGEKTKEIFSKMINLGEPDETCLETVFKEIQLNAKQVLETYFLNDTSNNKLLSKMEKISKFICDKENLDIAQEDEKLKRKVAMIKKEKERSSEMQRKLEIIEKKNSNQDMSLSPAAVSREPGQATSLPFIKLDEKTAEIVDEERKIKQKTSTFSPSSLLSKFESRKSPQN